jgi:hypothetical protein
MNGIHDMGGMQDMGPLQYEKNEPVFHADWERRVFAMAWATDTPPGGRYEIEIIPPAEYLRMSYYEKVLTSFERDHGVFDFEDTASQQLGKNPQHVYSVCFAARELWGQQAPAQDSVYIDMWDDYLEPA